MAQELTPQMQKYYDFCASTLDEDGFSIAHGLVVNPAGEVTILALAVEPQQAYQVMLMEITKQAAAEAIWALDRYAKPDQGTKYNDLLAGHHYVADRDKRMQDCFRGFTIEYRYEPRAFEPVDYDNVFWNGVLRGELVGASGGVFIRAQHADKV